MPCRISDIHLRTYAPEIYLLQLALMVKYRTTLRAAGMKHDAFGRI